MTIYDEEYFINKNEYYTLDSFEFENGAILNDVKVEYMTFGTPIYDDAGVIKNAIIYCHGSLGNYASMKKIAPLVGENDVFDENKYFFISLSALGSPGSCSPSTTDLKNKFPKYSVRDVVNFQKKFLAEKFNIDHVLGMIGVSMGGFVCLTSAIEYPDFADFIICGVSSYKVAGHDFILSRFVNEIIESDPDYNKGELTYSLLRTLRIASLAEFNFGTSDVLIISCKQDPHFPPELDAVPMSKMIKNSKLVIVDSDLGHLFFNELEVLSDELNEFLGEFDGS